MTHRDADRLALLALGEPDPAAESHLVYCPDCTAELAALREVVTSARSGPRPEELQAPPDQVWKRISAELELKPGRRIRRDFLLVLAACLVGVLAGVGVVSLADRPDVRTLSRAALEPLPGKPAHGAAEVQRTGSGLRLSVTVDDLPRVAGFYEVWLLDRAAGRLISVGGLPASGRAAFALPAGLDLAEFPVVDVSLEPYDGDPAHSKNSFARGTLPG
ncbi:MAG: anti-sigma factor [Streptosporangiaceae bacterium]